MYRPDWQSPVLRQRRDSVSAETRFEREGSTMRYEVFVDSMKVGEHSDRETAIRLWDAFRAANPDRPVSLVATR